MRSLLLLDLTFAATVEVASDSVIAVADTTSLASDALPLLCGRARRTFVGLGPLESPAFDADLAAAVQAPIDGIALPACRGGADLQHLAAKLAVAEAESGRPDGALGIIAFVAGSAGAVLNLGSLVGASPRLRAIIFDGASLGITLSRDGTPFATARALSVVAAKAAAVPAYAQLVIPDVEAGCQSAQRDGFAGLLTFRTDAITTINRFFDRGRRVDE